MRHAPCFALVLVAALLTATPQAHACTYVVEPLPATMPSHDVVLVGRMAETRGDRARVEVVRVVQGRAGRTAGVPAVWVDPCEGRHAMQPGRLYLLALDRSPHGAFRYSSDGPNSPIIEVASAHAAVVGAAALMGEHHRRGRRAAELGRLWAAAPDAVRHEVLLALYYDDPDPAFVPVLRTTLARYAEAHDGHVPEPEYVLGRAALSVVAEHRYRDAIPEVRRLAIVGGGLHGEAVWALARLRDPQAFGRFRDRVEADGLAVDLNYVTALGELGDPRAVPLLIDLLDQATASEPAPPGSSHPPGVLIAHALARLHAPEAVAPILRYFDVAPAWSKADVVHALREMGAAAASALPVLETIHERVENEAVARHVRMYADGALRHIREAVSAANAPPLCPCTGPPVPSDRATAPRPSEPSRPRVRLRGPLRLGPEHDLVRRAELEDPADVSLADLDGDGDLDVLTAARGLGLVGWYPNDGRGRFGFLRVVGEVRRDTQAARAADLDGDGDTDVLASSTEHDAVVWFENLDGRGHFGAARPVASGLWKLRYVRPADVDGDGDLDALVATQSRPAWCPNLDGRGTFGPPVPIASPSLLGFDLLPVDLDRDGDPDLVAAGSEDAWSPDQTHPLYFYPNTDGRGTYGPPRAIGRVNLLTALAAADVDGDGAADLVVGQGRGPTFVVPAGAPEDLAPHPLPAQNAWGVAAADFDGDGQLDVLQAGDDGVGWLRGRGDAAADTLLPIAQDGGRRVAAGDLDGDGDADAVVAHGDELRWYANDGTGRFAEARAVSRPVGICGPRLPSLADLDGDGDADLVIGTTCEGHAVWYPFDGDGDAGFGPARPVWQGDEPLLTIAALDLDGDGDTDLLARPEEGGDLLWFANDGHGAFAPPDTASVARDRVYAVTPSDFDGDGDPDLLASGWDRRGAVWLENAAGALTPRCVVAGLSPYGGVAATDVDGDGWEDLVTGSLDRAVAWYRNADGRGAFCPADTLTPSSARTSALRVGDLDGDGDPDVLTSVERPFDDGHYHGTLVAAGWYENRDGRGRFGPRHDIAGSERIRYERLVDLDGDGDLDLVGGLPEGPYGGGPYRLVWFPNRRGRFGAPQTLSGRRLSLNAGLLIRDLDGDGVLEVVVTSADQHGVWWARVTESGDR